MSMDRSQTATIGSPYPFAIIRERMIRHPGPVLDFSIAPRHEPPPDWLAAFVREEAGLAHRRSLPDEIDAFIEAAAQVLDQVYGVRVSPSSILPAPSGRAAMSALVASLIAPGDGVLVTEPGYPAFPRVATQRRARLTVLPLDPDSDFDLDVGSFGANDEGAGIRFAALNYPNNPTGAVISGEKVRALRERLDPDAVFFNDATYGPLTYGRPPVSLLSGEYAGVDGEATIELHSLGKLFALGPLGVAFLVGRDDLIGTIREYSEFAWSHLSSLHIRTGTNCLRNWDYVATARERFRGRLGRLRDVVTRLGLRSFPTAGGMYLMCRGPAAVSGRPVANAAEAAEALLRDHGLVVVPWEGPSGGYLRLSASYLPEELDALTELGGRLELTSR